MFQASRSQSSAVPRQLRLPKLNAVPGFGDVQFIMQECTKSVGRVVELPYCSGDRKANFVISVRNQAPKDDPLWTLLQINESETVICWKHSSTDLVLICNMLSSAAGSDTLTDLGASKAFLTKSADELEPPVEERTSTTAKPVKPDVVTFEPPKPGMKALLEGDLKNLTTPKLLQKVNQARWTGRLDVRTRLDQAQVYFEDGVPIHSVMKDTPGDSALIELITWTVGEFRFWPDERTTLKTINKTLDLALTEGIALGDQNKYLETNGLRLDSCLVKKNAMISKNEFGSRLSKGLPIELEVQSNFYEFIDSRTTLFDFLRKHPMSKAEWVPILFNLVSCGLIQIKDQAAQQNRLAGLKGVIGIDEAAVQNIAAHLLRHETGIYSYPAVIYFLDQEYLRYEYFNLPFSIIVFSLGEKKTTPAGDSVEPLQTFAIRRAMQRISLIKRQVDMLGHYQEFDYCMLLPNTNSTAAAGLATKIMDVLREAPLSSDMDSRNLALAFGVATVPEDYQEMDKLLLAANKARDKAKTGHQRVVFAREIETLPSQAIS
jgi:Domain of unknown function (DUF4388)/Diguanylate cyclase, GGDEF domain